MRRDQPRCSRRETSDREWPAGQGRPVPLPSDNTASTFWITNPNNTYRDNVAAGSDSNGFWMSLPEHPTGKFEGTEISKNTWRVVRHSRSSRATSPTPTTTRSCSTETLHPMALSVLPAARRPASENPADANSKPVESVFEDLTAYKNRNGAIWGRGELHVFKNVKLADNAFGFTHASGEFGRYAFTSKVIDSLFVGETENVGNPRLVAEKAYGRSLPKVDLPDYPIHGYEYYDYRHDVVNSTFVNFQDQRPAQVGSDICSCFMPASRSAPTTPSIT